MSALTEKKFLWLVGSVAFLILAQVAWWTYVFMDNVDVMERLHTENLELSHPSLPERTEALTAIRTEAFHRRMMFWSESAFFVALTCLGFVLLYKGYRSAQRNRQTQKNFVEIVSHESKTPLTALKLRLESLRDSEPSAHTRQEIQLALEEIRRLSGLFDKALNLTRLDAQAFQYQPLHLSDLVNEIVVRLDPLLKSRKMELDLTLDSHAVVAGDAYALQNSLQNIIENSILYNNSENGRLAVRLKQGGSKVKLSVEDNGPGIALEDRPHIFERFYRGRTGNGTPGTGLGLFITKYVIDAHRGSIELIPGQWGGTHFHIELPAVSA